MTEHRRIHGDAVAPRRPDRHTDHTTHMTFEGSTNVHTQPGTVAQAIHADRVRELSHPTRRTWMEARWTGRRRPPIRARLGRSIVRIGERIAADPALTPARSR